MKNISPDSNSENSDKTPALPRLAYTMKETAKILGVSYITVHRLLKRGLLRSSQALRHKLIPASEIERFLKTTLQ
jgi:excisionase family DNA binding protein